MKTAYATIKGFEIMRMLKKGQFNIWMYGTRTEESFINQQSLQAKEGRRPRPVVPGSLRAGCFAEGKI